MKTQVIQSFKRTSSLELKVPCEGLEISHKYCVGILLLSNHVHLISTDDLVQGNVSKLVNVGINAQRITCSEDRLAAAFNGIVSLYNLSDLKQPIATVNAKAHVRRMSFNPTDSSMLAVVTEDGNLTLVKLSAQGVENFALNETKITALCFSPKGKQLCVGHSDGSLSQLKLDLSIAKRIPGNVGVPLSILWVSTTQFLVTFLVNGDLLDLVQIDLQKAPAPPMFNTIGDPFVSDSANLQSQTFMTTLHPNAIISSATTSGDVVVLTKAGDKWVVELSDDDRKPDFPMGHHAVGQVFYFNSNTPVVVDAVTYNPMPVYVFASQLGTVRSFSIINSQEKGEGQRFSSGLAPLNVGAFAVQSAPVPQQQIVQPPPPVQPPPTTAAAPFSFFPSAPAPSEKPLPSFSLPPQQPAAPFSFAFNPNPVGTQPAPVLNPPQIPQPAPSAQATITPQSQPIMATPAKPKEEKHIGDAKKNLEAEMEKAQAAGARKDELSEAVLPHAQELRKRYAKFQATKSVGSTKLATDMAILKDSLESGVKDLHRTEDFLHAMEKTCAAQEREITVLKEKTVSDSAEMEYLKGIAGQRKEPGYLELLRARQIDPKTLKEFKAMEKSYYFLRSQLQECRKYYYFAKSPEIPAESPIGMAFIRETLSNHSRVLQRLVNENNYIRYKLGLHGCMDQLTEKMKETAIEAKPVQNPVVPAKKLDTMREFLKQRKVIRLKPDAYDYLYDRGNVKSMKPVSDVHPPKASPMDEPQPVTRLPTSIPGANAGGSGIKAPTTVPSGVPATIVGFSTPVAGASTTAPPIGISTTAAGTGTKSAIPSFGGPETTMTSSLPYRSATAPASAFSSLGSVSATTAASNIDKVTTAPTFGPTTTFPGFAMSKGAFITVTAASTPASPTITPMSAPENKTVSFGSPIPPITTVGSGIKTVSFGIATAAPTSGIKTVTFGTPITMVASGNKPTTVTLGTSSSAAFGSLTSVTPPSTGVSTITSPAFGFPGASTAPTISNSFPTFGLSTTAPSFAFPSTAPSAFTIPKLSSSTAQTPADSASTVTQSQPIPTSVPKPKDETLTITPVVSGIKTQEGTPTAQAGLTITPVPEIPKICSPFGSGTPTTSSPSTEIRGTTTPAFGFQRTATPTTVTPLSTAGTTLPSFGVATTPAASSGTVPPSFGIVTSPPLSASGTSAPPSFGIGTSSSSPFGAVSTTAPENKVAPFGTTIPAFGNLAPTSAFGSPNTTTAGTTSPFGSGITTSAATPAFGGITTSATPAFGTGIPTSATPFFGGTVTTASTPPAFGSGIPTTTATSIFGGITTTSATSPFGGGIATTSTPSLFGATTTTATSSPFGSGNKPVPAFGSNTFGGSGFLSGLGTSAPATGEVKNVFGGGSTFGQNVSSNIFGGGAPVAAPATTQPASNFSFTLPPGSQPSAFGSATSSIFGGASSFGTAAAPQPSFGGSAVFGSSPLSSFGTTSQAAAGTGGSIFGGGAQSAVGFGQLAQQSPGTGGFGGGGGSIFGGTSAFGAPSGSSPANSGSIFGGGSQFGQTGAGSAFGSTSGGSVFGGSSTFGASPAGGGTSLFGGNQAVQQQQSSPFGGGVGDGNMFGGGNSSFGSSPSFGQAGVPQQAGNIFGGAGSPFGGGGGGSAFGSGFSSFSTPPQQQQQQQQPAQSSPSFGGSSFSSWR